MDQSGSMLVGVMNKRFSTQKLFGPIINYSLFKGDIIVKIFLDSNKKRMTVYSPANPNGELFSDLPKDGIFYPAIQNKTPKISQKCALKVYFKFEQQIPKDKTELANMMAFSSGEDDGDDQADQTDKSIKNYSPLKQVQNTES